MGSESCSFRAVEPRSRNGGSRLCLQQQARSSGPLCHQTLSQGTTQVMAG